MDSPEHMRTIMQDEQLARRAAELLYDLCLGNVMVSRADMVRAKNLLGAGTPRSITRIAAGIIAWRGAGLEGRITGYSLARLLGVSKQAVYQDLKTHGYSIEDLMRRLT